MQLGDWADDTDDRDFFSCETCGFNEAENYELLKIGYDTLMGNYAATSGSSQSGGDGADPEDRLERFGEPADSATRRRSTRPTRCRAKAIAHLGFKSFSASITRRLAIRSPGSSSLPREATTRSSTSSACSTRPRTQEVEPPETAGGSYDPEEYDAYLQSDTQDGGLNTWLIEEVEWSGRPCNEARPPGVADLTATGGVSNRENNTVYRPALGRLDAAARLHQELPRRRRDDDGRGRAGQGLSTTRRPCRTRARPTRITTASAT